MMGFGGMGASWGWGGMLLGSIFMILFWVFVIAGICWLVLAISRGTIGSQQPPMSARSNAQAILEERLARGEIDVDEYNKRKAAIAGAAR